MIETGEFNSWLVEINAIIGRVVLHFFVFGPVVDDGSIESRLLFCPVPGSLLVSVEVRVFGELLGLRLVAEVVEVGALIFVVVWVGLAFGGAHFL